MEIARERYKRESHHMPMDEHGPEEKEREHGIWAFEDQWEKREEKEW